MARRLDKIEKEMGYCEVKLEKERRLNKQIEFLIADLREMDEIISHHRASSAHEHPGGERAREAGGVRRPPRESFIAAGLLEIVEEEREIMRREIEDLSSRLINFRGFLIKHSVLEGERKDALKCLRDSDPSQMQRKDEEFRKVERQWNFLTEDLINLDEGIFFLDRNIDYLRSCRSFLFSARGSFEIETWMLGGYLADLFRHSPIGRAKEMADGADRNLKLAQKELVCVTTTRLRWDAFHKALVPFLEGLHEDLFTEGHLFQSVQVVEAALAGNLKLLEQVKAKREALQLRLEQIDKVRDQLFAEFGPEREERRSRVVS